MNIEFLTFLRREIYRFMVLYKQTIVPALLSSLLYIIVFGETLGDKIPKEYFKTSYMSFIVPGLAMMSVITQSYQNSASSIIYEEAGDEANVILGCVIDDNLKDEVKVTVIATGLNDNSLELDDDVNQEQISFIRERFVDKNSSNDQPKDNGTISFGKTEDLEVPAFMREQK